MWVLVYLIDILIYMKTMKEQIKLVRTVLKKLCVHNCMQTFPNVSFTRLNWII